VPSGSQSAASFEQLGGVIREAMERLRVPGVAVGVHHHGEEQVAGFGITNVDNPLPVDADTLFQIGSTSKTVTATAVMRLVEQGKLDLEATAREYLPDFRLASEEAARQTKLIHLLTHLGGWVGDFFDDTGYGDDALAIYVARLADVPQVSAPGTLWSYNNAGFAVAGRVIEVVTGQPFEAAAHALVLDPIGLKRSFYFPSDILTYRVVAGHRSEAAGAVVVRPWPLARSANAAGGIISTVTDQLAYARFHLGDGATDDGTRLLTKETMARMQSPVALAGSLADAVGITWLLRDVGGTRIVQHGGSTNGQQSAFLLAPDQDFAITVLTNADRGAELHREVTTWALAHYLGAREPEPQPLTLTDAERAPYLGKYTAKLTDVELLWHDGTLLLQVIPKGGFPARDTPPRPSPPPAPVAIVAGDRLVGLGGGLRGTHGEFLRNPDGTIAWLRWGGRVSQRVPQ
jgi:CubicO group peptidase (beta-lactamase class C family)